ncbi:MAG TPA: hypothetical protein VKQ52_17360, partial [Puia sp.]|nr:hypothetical protein [Puia sp.]
MKCTPITPEAANAARQFATACRDHYMLLRRTIATLSQPSIPGGALTNSNSLTNLNSSINLNSLTAIHLLIPPIFPDGATAIPPSLTRLNACLSPDRNLSTLIHRLAPRHDPTRELFYGLHRENQLVSATIGRTITEYNQYRKDFFDNFYTLVQLHDELAAFVKGKTLSPAAGIWVEGYFRIFRNWVQDGGAKDIAPLLEKIMIPVINLNCNNGGSPFIHRSSTAALQARFAAQNIAALVQNLCIRLDQHATIYKNAIRITGCTNRHLNTPRSTTKTRHNSKALQNTKLFENGKIVPNTKPFRNTKLFPNSKPFRNTKLHNTLRTIFNPQNIRLHKNYLLATA